MTPGEKITKLSVWIDDGVDDGASEAQTWHRVAKCAEEAGEAVAALLGTVGRNPRKGVTHTAEDLEKELQDTAVSALGAIAHLHGNDPSFDPVAAMDQALDVLLARVGLS